MMTHTDKFELDNDSLADLPITYRFIRTTEFHEPIISGNSKGSSKHYLDIPFYNTTAYFPTGHYKHISRVVEPKINES